MTANVNPNVSQDKVKDLHHDWAEGFLIKKKTRVYHPYTRKDFKFGVNNNEL